MELVSDQRFFGKKNSGDTVKFSVLGAVVIQIFKEH